MTVHKRAFLLLTGCLLALAGTAVVHARPQYALARVIPLPGEGWWDYLAFEPEEARLFIAHGTRVEVIDTRRMSRVGAVTGINGAHGIATAAALNRGFVASGASDSVVIFDLKTLAVIGEVKTTGAGPDALAYDASTRRVFSFNGRGRNVTVIDAAGGTVVGTIALEARPEFAVADGAGHVYVNLEDRNSLAAIDATTLAVTAVWPLPGCDSPSGLALNARDGELFSVCDNHLMAVTDVHTGAALGSVPIGGGPDAAGYDPDARLAFASCGEGVVTVVAMDPQRRPLVAQTVPTQKGARTMALDPRTHRLFLVTADFGPAPPPTAEHPHPRPGILPDTFRLLVIDPHRQKFTTTAEGRSP